MLDYDLVINYRKGFMNKITTIAQSQTIDPFGLHKSFLDGVRRPTKQVCNICGADYESVCTNCDHVKIDADEQARADAYWYSRLKNEDEE